MVEPKERSGEAPPGVVVTPARDVQALHRHGEPRLVLFLSGDLVERALARRAACVRGDFVVRPPFFAHDGTAGPEGARYLRLGLSGRGARSFFAAHGWEARRGAVALDAATLAELAADPAGGDGVLAASATTTYAGPPGRPDLASLAERLSAADAPASLAALAEARGWRPWELTRRFAREFGLAPSAFRLQARIERALKLIAETSTALSAIAAEAGFADQSHLTRALKRATGRTPAALRRELALG